jgi:hypothetical protein
VQVNVLISMWHFCLCVELHLQMGSWMNWWPQNRQGLHLEELCYQLLVLLVWELFCSATILGIEIFSHEIFTLLSMCFTTAVMKTLLPIFKFLLSFPIRSYSCFCVSIDHLLLHSSAAIASLFCNEQNLFCDAEWSMEHLNTLQKILVLQQIPSFKVFGGTPSQTSKRLG